MTRLTNIQFQVRFTREEDGCGYDSAFFRRTTVHVWYAQVFLRIIFVVGLHKVCGGARGDCAVLACTTLCREYVSYIWDARYEGRSCYFALNSRNDRFSLWILSDIRCFRFHRLICILLIYGGSTGWAGVYRVGGRCLVWYIFFFMSLRGVVRGCYCCSGNRWDFVCCSESCALHFEVQGNRCE